MRRLLMVALLMTLSCVSVDALDRIGRLPEGLRLAPVAVGERVWLPLFGDVRLGATVEHVDTLPTGQAWRGTLDGEGSAVMVAHRGVVAGIVRTGDQVYKIGTARDGTPVVEQMDAATGYAHTDPLVPAAPPGRPGRRQAAKLDSPDRVEVMILYTADARDAAGGEAQIQAEAHLAVATTNDIYRNSGVPQRLRLVHTGPSPVQHPDDASDLLVVFRGDPGVHALRDAHGADVVSLFASNTYYVGLAYQLKADNASFFSETAYSVVLWEVASSLFVAAHEWGHNMGAQHDPAVSGPDDGYFTYSHGYVDHVLRVLTVMAYGTSCNGCGRVPYYSSPDVFLDGRPLGTPNASDNARSLRETAATVANFRPSVYAVPPELLFDDVPEGDPFFPWVAALVDAGVTQGCSASPPLFCPDSLVTRGEMAVLLIRAALYPAPFALPAPAGLFADVPPSHPFAAWIEGLAMAGVTSGCDVAPLRYCPAAPVTRAEIAVLLLRAEHGAGYQPPAATGTMFADVPASHPFASWIEQLAAEGITSGCGPGTFCPTLPVTRGQLAVFLVKALL